MKTKLKLPAYTLILAFILAFFIPDHAKAQYDDISLETFYDELSPYGDWIRDAQYGYVWRPYVDQDEFRPYYSNGHWEMTRYGNTWVSDYEWGWAPFHYGRWLHSSRKGWLWVPDTHWSPAWVSWRSGGGHYGWAPLAPGININFSIGRIPDYYWVFVPQRQIYYSRYPRYDRRRNLGLYHNTVIINNTYVYNRNKYYTGPRAEDIRRITRQPVKIHDIRDGRPDRYAGQNRWPEVIQNTDRPGRSTLTAPSSDRNPNSGSTVQSPRPQRSADNSGSRGSTTGRSENPVAEKPAAQSTSRPGQERLPASSQRSARTYDNQQSRAAQSERQTPVERPANQAVRQAPAEREPSREQRPARQAAPAQPQVSSKESRQGRAEPARSNEASSGGSSERSSRGRPVRQ